MESASKRKVTVYPITGRQVGFISVPQSWCEECDLTIRAVRRVADQVDDGVDVETRPWLRHMFDAMRHGGWHAPVVTIDGKLFSQGVVPDEDSLRAALQGKGPPSKVR